MWHPAPGSAPLPGCLMSILWWRLPGVQQRCTCAGGGGGRGAGPQGAVGLRDLRCSRGTQGCTQHLAFRTEPAGAPGGSQSTCSRMQQRRTCAGEGGGRSAAPQGAVGLRDLRCSRGTQGCTQATRACPSAPSRLLRVGLRALAQGCSSGAPVQVRAAAGALRPRARWGSGTCDAAAAPRAAPR